ncbi:MAG: helix-turn-helix transcriptional regulator [Cyanobacteria bacterium SBLK]|nr:helix-turn-helix transcriptional regulator [Cyanobacteria bacterium SBLK]
MESQIDFLDSQTLAPRRDVTAGNIIVSSRGLPWEGIYIEKGENEEFLPDNVTVDRHYFAMNAGAALEWEWKDGKIFKTHRYETGDLWINPAGIPFSHRVRGRNQFVLLTLDPSKIPELLPDRPLLESLAFRREHQSRDKHLQALMQALLIEAEMGGPNGRLYADTLSVALAAHFVNHYSLDRPLELPSLHRGDRGSLKRVIEYIEANLAEDISLADMAREAGASQSHFSRSFKKAFGLTPYRYLMKRRVERAGLILKKESPAIARVAHQFGFTDQSHFTRAFKQIKGLTPKQFLQQ